MMSFVVGEIIDRKSPLFIGKITEPLELSTRHEVVSIKGCNLLVKTMHQKQVVIFSY